MHVRSCHGQWHGHGVCGTVTVADSVTPTANSEALKPEALAADTACRSSEPEVRGTEMIRHGPVASDSALQSPTRHLKAVMNDIACCNTGFKSPSTS